MKKIAIYPGSFNPFTIGHQNILEKAESIFGKENVIIAVGLNSSKAKEMSLAPDVFQENTRLTIKFNLPSKTVDKYMGFLTDFVFEKEELGYDVTIIRGLRDGFDLQYEMNLLRAMQDLKPDIKVIYLLCDSKFSHVSSSLYREFERGKKGAGLIYLAKEVNSIMDTKNK